MPPTPPKRGPGSNQHRDKPPLPAARPTAAAPAVAPPPDPFPASGEVGAEQSARRCDVMAAAHSRWPHDDGLDDLLDDSDQGRCGRWLLVKQSGSNYWHCAHDTVEEAAKDAVAPEDSDFMYQPECLVDLDTGEVRKATVRHDFSATWCEFDEQLEALEPGRA